MFPSGYCLIMKNVVGKIHVFHDILKCLYTNMKISLDIIM